MCIIALVNLIRSIKKKLTEVLFQTYLDRGLKIHENSNETGGIKLQEIFKKMP